MRIAYHYTPVPTIARFSQSDAFIRALIGPFGSGKSSGCVAEFPYRALNQRPGPDGIRRTRWAVVRNTYGQLRDTTIKTFHQWMPPQYFGKWLASEHKYTVNAFEKCEFEILFRALDKPEDVRNLLSLDLTGAWVNEVREIPWAIIEALQGRVGRYPPVMEGGPTWSGIWMDTNPPDSDSKFYKFFEENDWLENFHQLLRDRALPDFITKPEHFARIFHQPSGLAPDAENLANLPVGYYQRLQIGKKPEWVKVYVKGDYGFVTEDRAVFPEFNEYVHMKSLDPVPGRTIYRGWDFGLTPAVVFSQILPDGRWLIFDEMVSENFGIDRFSDEVLEHCSRTFKGKAEFEDYGDPAGQQRAQTDEKTCFEILQAKGIDIEPGLQSPAIRLESVRKPMRTLNGNGDPQFVLHPRCKVLRKAFLGGYHYRRLSTNAERFSTDPEKNQFSHPMDANQYVATILFGGGLTGDKPQDDYPQAPRDMRGRSSVTGY